MFTRRRFMQKTALVGAGLMAGPLPRLAAASGSWRQGSLVHVLPLASHDRLLINASFHEPLDRPRLRIGRREVEGERRDTIGRFWQFHGNELESDTEYELRLESAPGQNVTDSWPLRTIPAPDAVPERVRLMIYTCAGGFEGLQPSDGRGVFHSLDVRRRLLARGLSFGPDLVVGIGDQVYWDQSVPPRRDTRQRRAQRENWYGKYGHFDADLPVLGARNEQVLTRGLDQQIAMLYGVDFRSVSVILTQDDHDHFENDEANDSFITFPPSPFNLSLARTSQRLYFPEFLPDESRPTGMAGALPGGLSEAYGSFRYGRLLEMLIYDCRRYLSLKGPSAGFVDASAERWLARRTQAESDVRHLVHVPSTPMGWSAGKWGEWYPDLLQPDGTLGTRRAKPYWQTGWWAQHQRLLEVLSGQRERIPLIISGDLHAIGSGAIQRSGELRLERSVQTILSGPISSDDLMWPSTFRGTPPQVPSGLTVTERMTPIEHNGFTILDVDADGISVRQFAWHKSQSVAAIDTMTPTSEFRLMRG